MKAIRSVCGGIVTVLITSGCGALSEMESSRWNAYGMAKQAEWAAKAATREAEEKTKQLTITLNQAQAANKTDPTVVALQAMSNVAVAYGPAATATAKFMESSTPMPTGIIENTMSGLSSTLSSIAPFAFGAYTAKMAVGAIEAVSSKALDRPTSHSGDIITATGDIKDSRNTQSSVADGDGALSNVSGRAEIPSVEEPKEEPKEEPAVEEEPKEEPAVEEEPKEEPAVEEEPKEK